MNSEALTSGQKGSFTKLKNQLKAESQVLIDKIREQQKEIEDLRTALLVDDEDGLSIQTEVTHARDKTNESLAEVERLLAEIEEKHEALLNHTDGIFPEIEEVNSNIAEILEETKTAREKFSQTSELLYGAELDSENGLENQLKLLLDNYHKDLEKHNIKSKELICQIEGALSGATNVELAKAFQDQKDSYKIPKNLWAILFMLCIAIMVFLACDMNKDNIAGGIYYIELLKRLPVFGPLIWLALFASKQQSQNKRLEQEYAHKETITKTYVGHKHQIDKLTESEEKEALITKLASSTIDAIEFNPSSTLEKQTHKEDLPASEIFTTLKKVIDKLPTK